MITKKWRVYGTAWHRQRESFNPSARYDWSKDGMTRIVEVLNSDKTGTHDYSLVAITCNTEEDCDREFFGQLSDGIFENCRVGKVEEVMENEK